MRKIHSEPFIVHPPDDFTKKHPELRRLSHALSLKYTNSQVVTDDDLMIVGRALWDALDIQARFEELAGKTEPSILPIIIESDIAEIQSLPWEVLYHPKHGFIGKNPKFTISRRINSPKDTLLHADKGPLRILYFISLPEDLNPENARLNIEDEQIQVQETLMPWISDGFVKLEMPDDGRLSTLQEYLKSFQPHVLFLSGIGMFRREPHTGETSYGGFLFEGELGESEVVRDFEVARILQGTGVQLVVLSTSESGKIYSDLLVGGLMQQIGAQGIPHVIGMREMIFDLTGILFARILCDELARFERVDIALQSARISIHQELFPDKPDIGQWCLPILLSLDPSKQIIDIDFTPIKSPIRRYSEYRLENVSLPARFIGRRAELRKYAKGLLSGQVRKLLITGPAGQGKTSLAGKLAIELQKRGYRIFSWAALPEISWRDFEVEMEFALEAENAMRFDHMRPRFTSDVDRAAALLKLLGDQFGGRVAFFLDNLNLLQNPDTLIIEDAQVSAWIHAAQSLPDVILLTTSRWQIPNFEGEHLMLSRSEYGDFILIARQLGVHNQIEKSILVDRARLRRVYEVLGGNARGLELFAAATLGMEGDEEDVFLKKLSQAEGELVSNMAIEAIVSQLPENTKKLLFRMPAHQEPVPAEGIINLCSDLSEDPQILLERLLEVSLLEAQNEPHWDVIQYRCSPLVMSWIKERDLNDKDPKWLNVVANYHMYLYENERKTLTQVITAHGALKRANRIAEADQLALNSIVEPLTLAGYYSALLAEWLPSICNSDDYQTKSKALEHTGKILIYIGDYQNAISCLKQSLEIQQQMDNKEGEGRSLNYISNVYYAKGDYETALTYLKRSLEIQRQIGDKAGEGKSLNNISQIYYAVGDYETALRYLKQSLAIRQQIADKAGEGENLNNISQIYHAQGDYQAALAYLKQSLAIQQQIGDKAGEARSLNNISQIFEAWGDYETALSYLRQSLYIQQQIGDRAGEGRSLNNIAQIFDAKGEYETALAYLKQSLAIQQQIGDTAGEAKSLNNISQIFDVRGDYETALAYLKQSLTIQQQIGDKAGEGKSINNIAQIYYAKGDYETALYHLQQSLYIRQQIGDKAGEGRTLNNISQAYHAKGDYETALSYLKESLAIEQQIGDKSGEGNTLGNLGNTYAAMGDIRAAIEYYEKRLEIANEIGDRRGESASLSNLGNAYIKLGEGRKSLDYCKRALIITQEIGDRRGEGLTLGYLGNVHITLGEIRTAIEYYEKALKVHRDIGDRSGEIAALAGMGNSQVLLNDFQPAKDMLERALTIAQEIGERQKEFELLENLGRLYIRIGEKDKARTTYERIQEIVGIVSDHPKIPVNVTCFSFCVQSE